MDSKLVNRLDLDAFTEVTNKISKDYNVSEEEAEGYIMALGPKKLKKMGILEGTGWRDGYTKQSIQKRKEGRRKKNKEAKKAKRKNR